MSYTAGAAFRETAGYVSDPADTVSWLGEAYPTTKANGASVTAGWSASNTGNCRDRSTTVDARLAGINFVTAAGQDFDFDVPAAGTYTVHLAAGDPLTSGAGGNWDFYDGASLLFSITAPGTGFTDAQGNTWSAANWPLSQVGRDVTLTSGRLTIRSRDSNVNCIAYVGLEQAASGTAYTLTAAAGSFALAGSAAALRTARVLPAGSGSFAAAGSSAAPRVARRLSAGAGAYSLAGSDSALAVSAQHTLAGGSGQFALAGSAATLRVTRRLPAGAAGFALSGEPAGLGAGRRAGAGAGAFALAGSDATLTAAAERALAAGPGAFTNTGSAAGLRATRVLPASAGAFALTGGAAAFGAGTAGKGLVCATVGLRPSVGAAASLRPSINATAGLREC